jgi:hypothetical protein
MRRGVHTLLATLLVASFAPRARAAKSTASLVYVRSDLLECPEESEVRDAVSSRLGYDPFDPRAPTTVTAVITRERAGLRARVELRNPSTGATGVRLLTSAPGDCTELASAMELAISIAIDPLSAMRTPGTPPSTDEPIQREPTRVPAEAPTAPPVPKAEPARPMLLIGGAASVGYGTTPSVSFAPVVFAGVRLDRFSLRVDGRFYVPGSEDATPRGSVRGSLLGGALAPCVHFGPGTGCAVVLLGRFHGEGRGVDLPKEDDVLHVAAGARVGVEWPLGRHVFVPLGLEALVPLTRQHLRLRDRAIWEAPPVTAAAMLGVGATFW